MSTHQELILQPVRGILDKKLIILFYIEIFSSITKIGVHPATLPDFYKFVVSFQKSMCRSISRIKHCYCT